MEKHNVVYKNPCGGNKTDNCQKVYVGTTKNQLKARIKNHNRNSSQKTALARHCIEHQHFSYLDYVRVLGNRNELQQKVNTRDSAYNKYTNKLENKL